MAFLENCFLKTEYLVAEKGNAFRRLRSGDMV
jgi:hypothetical protein